MDDESKRPTVRVDAIKVSDDDDEATAMLSREEILAQAARDRDELRGRKSTLRVNEPIRVDDGDRSAKTREMPAITPDTTVEVEQIQLGMSVETTDPTVDSTMEFAAQGISIIDDGEGGAEFPARVEEDLRIPVPAEMAAELGLQPGDLVMVEIRKVGD